MNRREAIAGMIGAVGAAALPMTSGCARRIYDRRRRSSEKYISAVSRGHAIITFFRGGVLMGRYENQTEAQGKPLESIWRENGYRFT